MAGLTVSMVLHDDSVIRTSAQTSSGSEWSEPHAFGVVRIDDDLAIQGRPDELYRLAEHVREAARLASEMHGRIEATAAVMQP